MTLPSKSLWIGGAVVAVLVAGFVALKVHDATIREAGRQEVRQTYADTIAAKLQAAAKDSFTAASHRLDSAKVANAQQAAQAQAKVNAAARATNQALASGAQIEAAARLVLRDSAATLDSVRAALGAVLGAAAKDSSAFAAERAANDSLRQTLQAQVSKVTAQAASGLNAVQTSNEAALGALRADMAAQVNTAHSSGLRTGRTQAFIGTLAGEAVVTVAVIFLRGKL